MKFSRLSNADDDAFGIMAPDREGTVVSGGNKALYNDIISLIRRIYGAARTGERFGINEGMAIIDRLMESDSDMEALFGIALHQDQDLKRGLAYYHTHPVNLAVMAMKLGRQMGLDRKHIREIGMTALLHDIGTVRIPDEILNKSAPLSKVEIEQIRQRPNFSYEILKDFRSEHIYLPETAVQVYERIDGSGYPLGLQRDDIHTYAQIIGLVDVYEALIHNRPQRKKFMHLPAAKEIVKTYKNRFQRNLVKALLSGFTIFPVHTYVRLNSGAIGRVMETYADLPLRPRIQVMFDSQKRRVLMERIINLPDQPLLNIIDFVRESEIHDLFARSGMAGNDSSIITGGL